MRKKLILLASAAALAIAPVMVNHDVAEAGGGSNFVKGLIGGIIAGAVINSIVQAGQSHCHGRVCHSHGHAQAYHYHDAYGRILYRGPVYAPPPPPPPQVYAPPQQVQGGYSQAHYSWCASKYRSYDPGSNSYQPYGNVPRRACVSPY